MRVFISWAHERSLSHQMALHIKEWLSNVFVDKVECFVSSTDISAGSVWVQELFEQLEQSDAGIICVTRESMARGWMLFEAGALAKKLASQTQRVCPLLLDLEPAELQYPLAAFQWKAMKSDAESHAKEGMLSLVRMINDGITATEQLPDRRLDAQFNAYWPDFWGHYRSLIDNAARSTTTPIVQIGNNDILVELRSGFRQVIGMLAQEQRAQYPVNCPQCGTGMFADFPNVPGATRHITCTQCQTRLVAHLGSDRSVTAKLVPLAVSPEQAPQAEVSCPACNKVQTVAIHPEKGATRHVTCVNCSELFIAHRNHDERVSASPISASRGPRHEYVRFLQDTQMWLRPDKTLQLVHMLCEADEILRNEGATRTPAALKKALLRLHPEQSSSGVNTLLKAALMGGGFDLVEPGVNPFGAVYENQLRPAALLRSFYAGMIARLRKFPYHLSVDDLPVLRTIFEVESGSESEGALEAALDAALKPQTVHRDGKDSGASSTETPGGVTAIKS